MLICRLRGHKPYVEDKPNTFRTTAADILDDPEEWVDEVLNLATDSSPETQFIFGGIRRYCGRCGITLEGDEPKVGDWRCP